MGDVGTTATIDFTGRKETIATVVFSNELSYDPAKYAFDQDGPDKGSEVKRGSVEKPPSDV